MADHRMAELAKKEARKHELAQAQAQAEQTKQLKVPIEITTERLTTFMRRIQQAADHGETQILVLRFPSDLCSDRGRAINNFQAGREENSRRDATADLRSMAGEAEAARVWAARGSDRLSRRYARRRRTLLSLVGDDAMPAENRAMAPDWFRWAVSCSKQSRFVVAEGCPIHYCNGQSHKKARRRRACSSCTVQARMQIGGASSRRS